MSGKQDSEGEPSGHDGWKCPECGHTEDDTDDLDWHKPFPADSPNRDLEQPSCPECEHELPVVV